MEFKNFKLSPELKNSDLVKQNRDQLEQLDQMLEQFQDRTFDWSLNNWNGKFQLGNSIFFIKTSNLNKLLNPSYFDQLLKHWIILINVDDKEKTKMWWSEEYWELDYDIDQNQLDVNRDNHRNSYEIINFNFKNIDFTQAKQLFQTCLDFNNLIYNQEDQELLFGQSFCMQLSKKLVDQSLKTKTKFPQSLLKWCQQELQKQPRTFIDFKNHLYNRSVRDEKWDNLLKPVWNCRLDWCCYFTIDAQLDQIIVNAAVYDGENNRKHWFAPLQLTFKEFAKLVNDDKFNQIIAQWKNLDRQKAKANHIFNKF